MTMPSNSDQNITTPSQEQAISFDLVAFQRRLLNYILYAISAIGAILFFIQLPSLLQSQAWITLGLVSLLYLLIIVITLVQRIPFTVRVSLFFSSLFILAVVSMIRTNIFGDGRLYLVAFVVVITALMDFRIGFIGVAAAITSMVLIAVFSITGLIPTSWLSARVPTATGTEWSSAIFSTSLILIVLASLFMMLNRSYLMLFQARKENLSDLEQTRKALEQSNFSHVQDLQKRTGQIEVAGQIAREIALQANPRDLLTRTVNLIRENFGFYHVGVFLLDEKKEYAILQAATGEAGQKMLELHHRLRAGEEGLVGEVVARGEAHIALDVGMDAVHFKNPLLPETRSEMALPLTTGDTTIGVLDVQSKVESAFTTDDVRVLQIVADQLAIGMERSDLLTRLQNTVDELSLGFQQSTQTTWQNFLKKGGKVRSYQLAGGIERTDLPEPPGSGDAKQKNTIIVKPIAKDRTSALVPVRLRDQVLGVLNVEFNSQSVPVDVIEFLQLASERLALSLENARLLEEVEDRANQEHIVREISEKVTSSPDVSEILKTAAAELGKTLGVSSVKVSLKPETNVKGGTRSQT
jgi:GAF domain-containing protein